MSLEGFNIRVWLADLHDEQADIRTVTRDSAPAVTRYIRDTIRKRIPPGNSSTSGMSNRFPGYAATGRLKNMIVARNVASNAPNTYTVQVGVSRQARRLDHIKLYVHEYGKVIRPRRARFLVFRNEQGEIVFARRVRIRAKRFFRAGWDEARKNYGRVLAQEMQKRAHGRWARRLRTR